VVGYPACRCYKHKEQCGTLSEACLADLLCPDQWRNRCLHMANCGLESAQLHPCLLDVGCQLLFLSVTAIYLTVDVIQFNLERSQLAIDLQFLRPQAASGAWNRYLEFNYNCPLSVRDTRTESPDE
jgi:hypothetical protein